MALFRKIRAKLAKIIASGIVAAMITLIGAQFAFADTAATINDISKASSYAQQPILTLAADSIVVGDSNGNFNPKSYITRAEMIIMIVKSLGLDTSAIPSTATFSDVPVGHWAYKYVETAYANGIIKGNGDGTFGLNDTCTREQMATMFVQALGLKSYNLKIFQQTAYVSALTDKANISSWAKEYVEFALATGLMAGTGNSTFSPKDTTPREQAAVVTCKLYTNPAQYTGPADNYLSMHQFPELYDALKSSLTDFKGELNSDVSLSITDNYSGETGTVTGNVYGAVNPPDLHLVINGKFDAPSTGSSDINSEIYLKDNKLYIKDTEGNWTTQDLGQLAEEGGAAIDPASEKAAIDQLLKTYNAFPIKKAGDVTIKDGEGNDISAVKYTITLDENSINTIFSELLPMAGAGDLTGMLQSIASDYSCSIDIYLNSSNQVVKNTFNLTANIADETQEMDISILCTVDSIFSKIGEAIEITPPAM